VIVDLYYLRVSVPSGISMIAIMETGRWRKAGSAPERGEAADES
jgi:hypothetical protein